MKAFRTVAVALAMCAAASSASAAPILDTAGVATAVTFAAPYGYRHDILDHGYFAGGNIAGAILSVWLNDPNRGSEIVNVTIGIGNQLFTPGGNNDVSNGNGSETRVDIPLNGTSLADLMLDGLIDVTMGTNPGGDYTFLRSSLAYEPAVITPVDGGRVPEPFTLGLMGIGLAGLGFASRRKN
ncbi:PEP-CTERM sorting domain-containing protein [Massilia cavernae]|uniref:PEP-CTERM sorting domain-containing protein n=1 Tax=Massilia cavernae TaxID=2320864 RepID=A0A418Y7T8_9BURK|nr:PEP-CTERM sorting domain-containing protein [Massilia cavernae]RJG27049.1 PEP-CTERM sorting domain-containing protein [Massilia cavernae]